jgi:hypothetical protein
LAVPKGSITAAQQGVIRTSTEAAEKAGRSGNSEANTMSISIHIYLDRDKFYIPTVAQAKDGFYFDIEPVKVVKTTDLSGFVKAIDTAIKLGNPTIKTPSRQELSIPVILRHSTAKNWKQFESRSASWGVEQVGDSWKLIPYRQRADGRGTEPDWDSAMTIASAPASRSVEPRQSPRKFLDPRTRERPFL